MSTILIGGLLAFLLCGVMAMAGLGAAFLFVPLFHYLGVPREQVVPAALLLNTVSLTSATIANVRGRRIDWPAAGRLLVATGISSPLGARLSGRLDTSAAMAGFAGFLFLAGALMMGSGPHPRSARLRAAIVPAGLAAGFVGGLLGVGGGSILLPVLVYAGVEPKVAAGTTGLAVAVSSFFGFLGHAALTGLSPVFLAVTVPLAAAGSMVGSQLVMARMSAPVSRKILGALLWLVAAGIAVDSIR